MKYICVHFRFRKTFCGYIIFYDIWIGRNDKLPPIVPLQATSHYKLKIDECDLKLYFTYRHQPPIDDEEKELLIRW